jgi:hypothetical protein
MRMTTGNRHRMRPRLGATLALAAVAWLAAGCGRSEAPANSAPSGEVRGAPIQTLAKKSGSAATNASVRGNDNAVVGPTTNRAPGSLQANATIVDTPTSSVSPPVAAARPSTPAPTPAATPNGTINLNFDQLAGYTFEVTDDLLGPITNDLASATAKTNAKIPETVKTFDKKKVALKGFMLPLKVEGGLVTEMLIMKDQSMCCYGTTPRINDWVSVKMAKKGVRPTMDLPVTLFGTMRIGEMRENGYLVGIYSMEGEAMEAPDVD